MIVRNLQSIIGTERDVKAKTWESRRLILRDDGVGFSLHDTVLYKGTVTDMWYKNHIEAVYCIEGKAILTDKATGEKHTITPGAMYLLNDHDRHSLEILEDFRCLCVFNPPCTGRETHDEEGAYPLLT
ncbi:ectoine synthase [Paenibacillus sp. TRM 82003]|nr:ectoine synthase [Paenibacillus sp. TRM 82003]